MFTTFVNQEPSNVFSNYTNVLLSPSGEWLLTYVAGSSTTVTFLKENAAKAFDTTPITVTVPTYTPTGVMCFSPDSTMAFVGADNCRILELHYVNGAWKFIGFIQTEPSVSTMTTIAMAADNRSLRYYTWASGVFNYTIYDVVSGTVKRKANFGSSGATEKLAVGSRSNGNMWISARDHATLTTLLYAITEKNGVWTETVMPDPIGNVINDVDISTNTLNVAVATTGLRLYYRASTNVNTWALISVNTGFTYTAAKFISNETVIALRSDGTIDSITMRDGNTFVTQYTGIGGVDTYNTIQANYYTFIGKMNATPFLQTYTHSTYDNADINVLVKNNPSSPLLTGIFGSYSSENRKHFIYVSSTAPNIALGDIIDGHMVSRSIDTSTTLSNTNKCTPSISEDGKYAFIATDANPFFAWFKRNEYNVYEKMVNPSGLTFSLRAARVSPDGKYVVLVTNSTSVSDRVYRIDDNTLTLVTNNHSRTVAAYEGAWFDNTRFVTGCEGGLEFYEINQTTGQVDFIRTMGLGAVATTGVVFNAARTRVFMRNSNAPAAGMYTINPANWSDITLQSSVALPTGDNRGFNFINNGSHIITTCGGSPGLVLFGYNGTTVTRITTTAVGTSGSGTIVLGDKSFAVQITAAYTASGSVRMMDLDTTTNTVTFTGSFITPQLYTNTAATTRRGMISRDGTKISLSAASNASTTGYLVEKGEIGYTYGPIKSVRTSGFTGHSIFNPSGTTYLSLGASPSSTILYKRDSSGNYPVLQTLNSEISQNGNYSPDGTYVAYTITTAPFLRVYSVNPDDSLTAATLVNAPSISANTRIAGFSNNSQYLFVGDITNTQVAVFQKTGTSEFTFVRTFTDFNAVYAIRFNKAGTLAAIANSASITLCSFDSTFNFTPVNVPFLSSISINDFEWSNDDKLIYAVGTTSPYTHLISVDNVKQTLSTYPYTSAFSITNGSWVTSKTDGTTNTVFFQNAITGNSGGVSSTPMLLTGVEQATLSAKSESVLSQFISDGELGTGEIINIANILDRFTSAGVIDKIEQASLDNTLTNFISDGFIGDDSVEGDFILELTPAVGYSTKGQTELTTEPFTEPYAYSLVVLDQFTSNGLIGFEGEINIDNILDNFTSEGVIAFESNISIENILDDFTTESQLVIGDYITGDNLLLDFISEGYISNGEEVEIENILEDFVSESELSVEADVTIENVLSDFTSEIVAELSDAINIANTLDDFISDGSIEVSYEIISESILDDFTSEIVVELEYQINVESILSNFTSEAFLEEEQEDETINVNNVLDDFTSEIIAAEEPQITCEIILDGFISEGEIGVQYNIDAANVLTQFTSEGNLEITLEATITGTLPNFVSESEVIVKRLRRRILNIITPL